MEDFIELPMIVERSILGDIDPETIERIECREPKVGDTFIYSRQIKIETSKYNWENSFRPVLIFKQPPQPSLVPSLIRARDPDTRETCEIPAIPFNGHFYDIKKPTCYNAKNVDIIRPLTASEVLEFCGFKPEEFNLDDRVYVARASTHLWTKVMSGTLGSAGTVVGKDAFGRLLIDMDGYGNHFSYLPSCLNKVPDDAGKTWCPKHCVKCLEEKWEYLGASEKDRPADPEKYEYECTLKHDSWVNSYDAICNKKLIGFTNLHYRRRLKQSSIGQ